MHAHSIEGWLHLQRIDQTKVHRKVSKKTQLVSSYEQLCLLNLTSAFLKKLNKSIALMIILGDESNIKLR